MHVHVHDGEAHHEGEPRRGASTVEAAICVPVLLVLVFGFIELTGVGAGLRRRRERGCGPPVGRRAWRAPIRWPTTSILTRLAGGVRLPRLPTSSTSSWSGMPAAPARRVPAACRPDAGPRPNTASIGSHRRRGRRVGACNVYVRPEFARRCVRAASTTRWPASRLGARARPIRCASEGRLPTGRPRTDGRSRPRGRWSVPIVPDRLRRRARPVPTRATRRDGRVHDDASRNPAVNLHRAAGVRDLMRPVDVPAGDGGSALLELVLVLPFLLLIVFGTVEGGAAHRVRGPGGRRGSSGGPDRRHRREPGRRRSRPARRPAGRASGRGAAPASIGGGLQAERPGRRGAARGASRPMGDPSEHGRGQQLQLLHRCHGAERHRRLDARLRWAPATARTGVGHRRREGLPGPRARTTSGCGCERCTRGCSGLVFHNTVVIRGRASSASNRTWPG